MITDQGEHNKRFHQMHQLINCLVRIKLIKDRQFHQSINIQLNARETLVVDSSDDQGYLIIILEGWI